MFLLGTAFKNDTTAQPVFLVPESLSKKRGTAIHICFTAHLYYCSHADPHFQKQIHQH